MKKSSKITIVGLVVVVFIGLFSTNLFAQNRQDYKMSNVKAEHYIKISREEVEKDNLPLAKVYAQKAVQANSWSKKSWANYDDVAQRIADDGDLGDFETFIEQSEAQSAPSAGDGQSKFEGC